MRAGHARAEPFSVHVHHGLLKFLMILADAAQPDRAIGTNANTLLNVLIVVVYQVIKRSLSHAHTQNLSCVVEQGTERDKAVASTRFSQLRSFLLF